MWSQEWWRRELFKPLKLVPIPSLWGHSAGGGGNKPDGDFLDAQIAALLK